MPFLYARVFSEEVGLQYKDYIGSFPRMKALGGRGIS